MPSADLEVPTHGQGLIEITRDVAKTLDEMGVSDGLCTVFVRHTSASIIVQENADPTARQDLERWLNRLVAEDDPLYQHTAEGSDDMPAHIKSALTATSINIPIRSGALVLGTWQGIYLWEHRHRPHRRHLVVQALAD